MVNIIGELKPKIEMVTTLLEVILDISMS